MRTAFDSITASDIPLGARVVAGYVDGRYAWSAADWARFPNAVKVRIAVSPQTNDGHVLDCEAGDATPEQCPDWVQMRRDAGVDPTVYTGEYQWQAVKDAFAAAHVPEPHWWIARWSGVPGLIGYTVATQYANPTLSGGHYDLSTVADFWPGVDGADVTPDQVRAIVADYIAITYGPALEAELVQRLGDVQSAAVAEAISGAVKAVSQKLAA